MQIQFQAASVQRSQVMIRPSTHQMQQPTVSVRFGNHTPQFKASEALSKALDHMLNPLTAYLPFGMVAFRITPGAGLPAIGSRMLVRMQQTERMELDVATAIPSSLNTYSHVRNTSNLQDTHFGGLDLHAPEIALTDGKQFTPFTKAAIANSLDLTAPQTKSRRTAQFMNQLCTEYTAWLKTNGPLDCGGFTLSEKNGKIIADQFRPYSGPTLH